MAKLKESFLHLGFPNGQIRRATIVKEKPMLQGLQQKTILSVIDNGSPRRLLLRKLSPMEFRRPVQGSTLFQEYHRKWQRFKEAGLPVIDPLIDIGEPDVAVFPYLRKDGQNFFYGKIQMEQIEQLEIPFDFGPPTVVKALASLNDEALQAEVDRIVNRAGKNGITLFSEDHGAMLVDKSGRADLLLTDFADSDVDSRPNNIEEINKNKGILLFSLLYTSVAYARKIIARQPETAWYWDLQA